MLNELNVPDVSFRQPKRRSDIVPSARSPFAVNCVYNKLKKQLNFFDFYTRNKHAISCSAARVLAESYLATKSHKYNKVNVWRVFLAEQRGPRAERKAGSGCNQWNRHDDDGIYILLLSVQREFLYEVETVLSSRYMTL